MLEFLLGYLQCVGGCILFLIILGLVLSPLLFLALREIDDDYYREREQ